MPFALWYAIKHLRHLAHKAKISRPHVWLWWIMHLSWFNWNWNLWIDCYLAWKMPILINSNCEASKQGLAFSFPLGSFQLHMPHQQHQLQKVHHTPPSFNGVIIHTNSIEIYRIKGRLSIFWIYLITWRNHVSFIFVHFITNQSHFYYCMMLIKYHTTQR